MAKKKSKKKQQSAHDILERAEKLFKKKSFQAALREYGKFEKINKNKTSVSKTVAEHISVCREEVAAIRAGELVKKARRLLKKGNSAQALQFFQQAFDLTGDERIAGIIAGLQTTSDENDLLASADKAEEAGDYSAAAGFLSQLHAGNSDTSLLCRRARCLVMAGQWSEAVDAYAEADCLETVDLYNYGFAQALQHKYLECLKLWQQIQSDHSDFTRQKEVVFALLLKEIEDYLDEDPPGREAETRQQIQSLSGYEDSPAAMQLLKRCRLLQLAGLWQQNRIREIGEISDKTDLLNLTVLAVHAKAAFIHVEKEASRLSGATMREFIDFWLSALFNPVSGKLPGSLFDSGLELVKKYGGYHPQVGKQLLSQWEDSFTQLTILDTLRADGKMDHSIPLLTPALALRAGICEELLTLIKANEDAFPDRTRFLDAGADYSRAAAALLMVRNVDTDGAFAFLDMNKNDNGDPFVAHAEKKITLACGLQAMVNREFTRAETLLVESAPMFMGITGQKTQLLAMLDDEEDWDEERLGVCANILSAWKKESPSEEIDHALCRVMTRRAVEMFNKGKRNVRVLVTSLEKAAALNPDDEFTKFQLEDARRNLEVDELNRHISRFKLSAASSLAAKSSYSDVREMYFEFIGEVCEQAGNEYDAQPDANMFLFRKLLKHAVRVDPLHPVVSMLEAKIAQKEMWT